jgi:phospholipid transport system substrate-binding protein
MFMTRSIAWLAATVLAFTAVGAQAQAATAPEALIKEVSTDVLDAVKADKSIQQGDIRKVIALVDQKVLPYVNFQRMTASAVGRYWKQATPISRSACRTSSSSSSSVPTRARSRR